MTSTALATVRGRRGDDGVWELLDRALEYGEGTSEPLWIAPVRAARTELRWLEGEPDLAASEAEAGYARTQFMPFGFGPRTCIGSTFAMMEATAILATLVRRARFEWDGVHAPEPLSRVTLRPKGGMPLQVWLRD